MLANKRTGEIMKYILTVQKDTSSAAQEIVVQDSIGVLGAVMTAEAQGWIVLSYHSQRTA